MDGHPDSSSNLHQEETGDSRRRRKIKKHFVEKRRRCRINLLLEQMKSLVLTAMEKNPQQYEKMEKVDILELTVGYLRELRRLHMNRLPLLPIQQQPQQHLHHQQQQQQQQQQVQYRDGYVSAMNEVRDLLARQHGMTEVSSRLAAHLQGSLLRGGERQAVAAVSVAQTGTNSRLMSSTASTTGSSSAVPDSFHLAARLQHHLPTAGSSSSFPALFPLSIQFSPSQQQATASSPSGGLLMTSSARNAGGLLMTSRSAASSLSSHFPSPPYTKLHQRHHGNLPALAVHQQQMQLMQDTGCDNVVHSASDDNCLRVVKQVTGSQTPPVVTCSSPGDMHHSDDTSSSSSSVSDGEVQQLSPQFVWRPF